MTALVEMHPVGFDLRTRVDGPHRSLDAATFFTQTLPAAFEQAATSLSPFLEWRLPKPLTIRIKNQEWTLRATSSSIYIDRGGSDDARLLCLQPRELDDLIHDLVTPNGWFTQGTLRSTAPLTQLLDWWLLLRGALDGSTPYVPGSVSLLEADGSPLQLTRTFSKDDPPGKMRYFLRHAGFIRICNVFTKNEMIALSRDMDLLAPLYSPSDGRSFWARTSTNTERLVRMQYFDAVSERAAAVVSDDRISAVARLTGEGHEANCESGLVEALVKPTGIADQLSDFPWHKDCSLGRHSYECCSLTIGVSVTPADEVRGMLRVIAGSHRALMWPVLNQPGIDLPVVDLPANTGDITLHLSCTMHMSQPPMRSGRRVLYIGFRLPEPDSAAAAMARVRTGLRTTDLA